MVYLQPSDLKIRVYLRNHHSETQTISSAPESSPKPLSSQ